MILFYFFNFPFLLTKFSWLRMIVRAMVQVIFLPYLDTIIDTFRFRTLWVLDISSGKMNEVFEGLIL